MGTADMPRSVSVLHHGPAARAGGVQDDWERNMVRFEMIQGDFPVIRSIDANNDQPLVFILLIQLLETPCLLAAFGSATPPFVEPDHLATEIRQLNPAAVG